MPKLLWPQHPYGGTELLKRVLTKWPTPSLRENRTCNREVCASNLSLNIYPLNYSESTSHNNLVLINYFGAIWSDYTFNIFSLVRFTILVCNDGWLSHLPFLTKSIQTFYQFIYFNTCIFVFLGFWYRYFFTKIILSYLLSLLSSFPFILLVFVFEMFYWLLVCVIEIMHLEDRFCVFVNNTYLLLFPLIILQCFDPLACCWSCDYGPLQIS